MRYISGGVEADDISIRADPARKGCRRAGEIDVGELAIAKQEAVSLGADIVMADAL